MTVLNHPWFYARWPNTANENSYRAPFDHAPCSCPPPPRSSQPRHAHQQAARAIVSDQGWEAARHHGGCFVTVCLPFYGLLLKNATPNSNGAQKSAYHTLSHIGQKMLEKLIMKAKTEIQQTLSFHVRPATASGPSINTNHIKHAANCLQIPAEITEDAIDMSTRQAFDNTAL